jgi:hypothetical protein
LRTIERRNKNMDLKDWMQKKIEKGAIKSNLDGDTVIMKKSKIPILGGDWVQIHPPVNEDGSINYVNLIFGGWRNLKLLIALLIIASLVLFALYEVSRPSVILLKDPCVQQCLKAASNFLP